MEGKGRKGGARPPHIFWSRIAPASQQSAAACGSRLNANDGVARTAASSVTDTASSTHRGVATVSRQSFAETRSLVRDLINTQNVK